MAFPNPITANPDILFGGEWPNFMAPPNGVFETNSTTRYTPEPDLNTLAIRMMKTTDNGVTWAEVDAAHAPVMAADGSGGTGFTQVYQFIGAVIDPATKILYTVYFDQASFNIALAPFDANPTSPTFDKWRPSIISTLSYLPNAANQYFNEGSFALAFRPVDKAVWMLFYGGGADANDVATVWGAKCIVTVAGTGTWDLALTRMAGILHDGIEWAQAGIGVDNNNNVCYWTTRHYSGFGAAAHLTVDGSGNINGYVIDAPGSGYLAGIIPLNGTPSHPPGSVHCNVSVNGGGITSLDITAWLGQPWNTATQSLVIGTSPANQDLMYNVIHPDNSIVGPQFVVHDALQILQASAINCTPGNVLISTYASGANNSGIRHVLRAPAGDTPVWEDTLPTAAQDPGNQNQLMSVVHRAVDGLDYIVFALRVGATFQFFYSTSAGIGKPFGPGILIGTAPATGGPPIAFGQLVAMIFDNLALTFGFGTGAGFPAIGMGYFELALPVPPPILTLTFKGMKVYPR